MLEPSSLSGDQSCEAYPTSLCVVRSCVSSVRLSRLFTLNLHTNHVYSIMDELEDSWRRLALTEQEKDVVEVDTGEENEEEEGKYLLVGSLWSVRPFNNQAMLGLMKSLWRPRKGMDTDVIGDNRFLFTLYWKGDVECILEGRPWMFDKHVLLLQDIHCMEQPNKVPLEKATFWIRLYDLPVGAMKEGVILKLGGKAGKVISIGYKKNQHLGGWYARARVEFDVRQALVRWTKLQIRGGEPMFITFKYE